MNMTTVALCDLTASASANDWPSTDVSLKSGAAAPIAGPSARATPSPTTAATRATEAAMRRDLMATLSFGRAAIADRRGLFRRFRIGSERLRRQRVRRRLPGSSRSPDSPGAPNATPGGNRRMPLHREQRSLHHRVELPDVLVRPAEEV